MICEDKNASVKRIAATAVKQKHAADGASQSVSVLDSTVHHQFEMMARQIPEEPAVILPELPNEERPAASLTYGELNRRAEILCWQLVEIGVKPDQVVAIFMDRSLEMIVALLGVLKAGAAYLPLDPAYPVEKLSFMMKDTDAKCLITQSHLLESFSDHNAHVLCLDRDWGANITKIFSSAHHDLRHTGEKAIIYYTSGSTGTPKGVIIPHRGVLRLVIDAGYATFDRDCRMLQIASISFDAATFEIWGALLNGGRLILFPYNGIPDPLDLDYVINKNMVTTMLLTTSLFNAVIDIVPEALQNVRELLTGGEAASMEHVKKAIKLLPQTQLINAYGPTENSTITTCYRIPKDLNCELNSIPIGSPINYTDLYILNEYMQPVPAGEIGELYIGGDGLAIGYLNRPELTEERFVSNPFEKETRLYKTGDLVRCLPGNQIEYMGRIDDQIKISGFRIEPGEIESVLRKHETVRDAAVIVYTDKAGSKYLVGYVTAAPGQRIDSENLQSYLRENLAKFMVPRELIILDRLPINPNGKLDRNALPKPASDRKDPLADYLAPRSENELALAEIWCEVLGIERVGIRNNFFDIGGTSVLSAKLITKIRNRFNVNIPIIRVYHYPTIESMANFISRGKQSTEYAEAKGRAQKQRAAFLKRKQQKQNR